MKSLEKMTLLLLNRVTVRIISFIKNLFFPIVLIVFVYLCVYFSTKKIKMEKFYKFRETEMLNTFNIRTVFSCEVLHNWLNTNDSVTEFEDTTLNLALNRYAELGKGWNEEELKMHFISTIFNVANPNIANICKTYFERPLEGVINNYLMHVITDCMIASPKLGGDPDKPYFFLQEFKQSQRFGRTDPQGQMLAAMLLAQKVNDDNKHLYGCFVVENNWRFTTLHGLDYCVSHQFDATRKSDLLQIVFILRKLKELILNR
jgi:hypothetical protein